MSIAICKETHKSSSQEFDKQLVYVAGGGLVLTVGFVKEILNITKAENLWMLLITWVGFTLALLCNLISHKISVQASDEALSLYNYRKYCFNYKVQLEDSVINEHERKASRADKWVNWLNSFSIGFTILSVLFFVVFTFINLNNGKPGEPRKPESNTTEQNVRARSHQRAEASIDGDGSSSVSISIKTGSENDSIRNIK